jgi:3-deoxy-D-manno-octulosonic acid kinase
MSAAPMPPDLADTFESVRRGRTSAIVRIDFRPGFEALGLDRSPHPPDDAEPTKGGRGEAWIASLPTGDEAVVRPGRRGGWFGRLVRRRYFLGDRFVAELVLTERLRRRGAPVPMPLAAVRRERRVGYETWMITRRIPAARPAAELLGAGPEAQRASRLETLGYAVGRLHAAGGDHADLNAWNVLLDGDDAYVVDLDRGRLRTAPLDPGRAAANLSRLRRSLERLGLDDALAAWSAFERGYAAALRQGGAGPVPPED